MKNESRQPNGVAGLLLMMWMSHAVLASTTIYVDPQAPGANNGSSWEDAYICLQNALESAQAGDEIRVAQGLYNPDRRTSVRRTGSNREIYASGDNDETFSLPEGVAVMGGYAGYNSPHPDARDVDTFPSILSGDLHGNDIKLSGLDSDDLYDFVTDPTREDNCHTVVRAWAGVTESSVLDGFTITGGRGVGTNAETAVDPAADGAGAHIDSASPRFVQCTFYRNTTHASDAGVAGGAGVACRDANPTFEACSFVENIALADHAFAYSYGGGLFCCNADPVLIDCAFTRNMMFGTGQRNAGGAVACVASDPRLMGCSFVGNRAACLSGHTASSFGGAVYGKLSSEPILTDCYFERNSAYRGGAFCSEGESNSRLTRCTFWANTAFDPSYGSPQSRDDGGDTSTDEQDDEANGIGGALDSDAGSTTATNCRFLGNRATSGGAVHGSGELVFVNCLFSGNTAQVGAGLNVYTEIPVKVINCTFVANQASNEGSAYRCWGHTILEFSNCILWEEPPIGEVAYYVEVSIAYSNVRGGGDGLGNINADPRFQDPNGADDVPGTLDDDLRLSVGSPCIDAGRLNRLPAEVMTDLAGQARIAGAEIDMGAYEFDGPYNYYVDAASGDDAREGYSPRQAFATILRGMEAAEEGYTVVVLPGLYSEEINFDGKSITVSGSEGGAILEAPGGYGVSFYAAERSTSILKNLAIQNCDVGIFIAGTSPTIQNVTLANNKFGIAAYAGAIPDISNCILWDNIDGDLFDCTTTYSCVEQGSEGEGNISEDPLFADANNADYHLLAEEGRFVPAYGLWAFDETTSLCVDAGNPYLNPGTERMPNGGRINMGAFGGTPQASMSEWPLAGDINRDGIVDEKDQEILNEQWLDEVPGLTDPTSGATNSLQPNPPRWDIEGQPHEVHDDGGAFDYYVEMTAGEVVSPDGPVEYFFECDQSDFDSGWQLERTYNILVGRTGQGLSFRVRARDSNGNMTDWSNWVMAMPYEMN
jgi:parallel beta helix pectate lyase-like protein